MKIFGRNRLNVIFLIPVAIALNDGGGCSTQDTSPKPLSKAQIEQVLPGNTVKLAGEESFALVRKDGSLVGFNLPSGGKTGQWRLSDNGILCAKWNEGGKGKENCDQMHYLGGKKYSWGGSELQIVKGNPKVL